MADTTKPEISVRFIRQLDGTLIDPLTRQPVRVDSPSSSASSGVTDDGVAESPNSDPSPNAIVPLSRRSLLDLTLNKQQMAVVNNVLVYTMWGLPDDEIAIQCQCDLSDIETVRGLTEYTKMRDALIAGMRASYTASAHGVISKHAVDAAHVVASNLRSPSKRMQFDAARDILDRSGHRPADHAGISINLNKGTDDQLVIRIVRESERPNIPTLDIRANGA
jgi:hypothetical protein